jgi:hypothetical protein
VPWVRMWPVAPAQSPVPPVIVHTEPNGPGPDSSSPML